MINYDVIIFKCYAIENTDTYHGLNVSGLRPFKLSEAYVEKATETVES